MENKLKSLIGKKWVLKFGKHQFVVSVKDVRKARIKDMKNPIYDDKPDGGKSARKMILVECEEGNLFFEEGEIEYSIFGITIRYDSYSVCFSYQ